MKVVVIVQGGVVHNVITDNSETQVLVLDCDNESDQVFTDFDGNEFNASASTNVHICKALIGHYYSQVTLNKGSQL